MSSTVPLLCVACTFVGLIMVMSICRSYFVINPIGLSSCEHSKSNTLRPWFAVSKRGETPTTKVELVDNFGAPVSVNFRVKSGAIPTRNGVSF